MTRTPRPFSFERGSITAAVIALLLDVTACARPAQGQRTRAAAPLAGFTVTYVTEDDGAVQGPRRELSIQADGTARLDDRVRGNAPAPSAVVHLPAREVSRLAAQLANPAFARLTSTPTAGEGHTTIVDVRSPRLNVHYTFYPLPPSAAEPVVDELARLRLQVVRALIADASAHGACATDADCELVPCDCTCSAIPHLNSASECPVGHCTAAPCRAPMTATCDAQTHRCAIATDAGVPAEPARESCPSGVPEVVSPLCEPGAVCGWTPDRGLWRGRCVAPGAESARCDPTSHPCDAGLVCDRLTPDSSYCRHAGGLGASCGVAGSTRCIVGLHCALNASLGANVCQP